MSRLPRISGRECAKALIKVGFYLKRQRGSHIILRRDEPFAQVIIPDMKSWTGARCGQSSDTPDLLWMSSEACSED